jgi:hypothetical protein
LLLSSRKYDPRCSQRSPFPDFFPSRIRIQGAKKAPSPGSATLARKLTYSPGEERVLGWSWGGCGGHAVSWGRSGGHAVALHVLREVVLLLPRQILKVEQQHLQLSRCEEGLVVLYRLIINANPPSGIATGTGTTIDLSISRGRDCSTSFNIILVVEHVGVETELTRCAIGVSLLSGSVTWRLPPR